jgi:hypothetical protein
VAAVRARAALLAAVGTLLFAPRARAEGPRSSDGRPPAGASPSPFYDEGRDRLGWYTPDYVRLGSGGFLGALVVGVGYDVYRDVVNVGVSYGYAPPLRGDPAYHSVSTHLALRPLHVRLLPRLLLVPIYLGGGAVRFFGPNLFVEQPSVYPPGYYPPTALHATAYLGAELDWLAPYTLIERHGVYYEALTLGQYLATLVRNDTLQLFDAFSSFVGYRATF